MANPSHRLSLCVVTPTFRREALLRRFLRRIRKQTYRDWGLVVVHDGPSHPTRSLVERFGTNDPRIEYLHTAVRSGDVGVSPRYEGLKYVLDRMEPDYVLFWDDDNYFAHDALQRIADALESCGRPDMLIVSMKYGGRILPPRDGSFASYEPGQIDMGCLVVRPLLALEAYSDLLRQKADQPGTSFYTQDYMLFDRIRRRIPAVRIGLANDVLVGYHDGLRWKPYIRHLLGIPPLHLADRHWLLGRVLQRR